MSLLYYSHHYVGLITCCVNHLQILRNLRKKKDTDGTGCECTLCILLDIHGD